LVIKAAYFKDRIVPSKVRDEGHLSLR